jgi:hypothetical protein
MGIDVPAFGSRVDRPSDAGVQRGSVRAVSQLVSVSAGSVQATQRFRNLSNAAVFLQSVSLSQALSGSRAVQSDVRFEVRTLDSGGTEEFSVAASGESLTEVVPRFPIDVGGSIVTEIDNASASSITVKIALAILTE